MSNSLSDVSRPTYCRHLDGAFDRQECHTAELFVAGLLFLSLTCLTGLALILPPLSTGCWAKNSTYAEAPEDNMERGRLNVLLIGESERGWGQLSRHLEHLGCHCWFASTMKEIGALLESVAFRLVLSSRPVTEGSALMGLLSRPDRGVFYSYPVESSCLWFEAAPHGRSRLRSSALRPSEFTSALNNLVFELQKSINTAQSNDVMKASATGRS
jgi:hypothetical protein